MRVALLVAVIAVCAGWLATNPFPEESVESWVSVPPPDFEQVRVVFREAIGSGVAVAEEMRQSLGSVLQWVRGGYHWFVEARDAELETVGLAVRRFTFACSLFMVCYGLYWHMCRSRIAVRAREELELLDRDFPDAFMTLDEAEGVVFGGLWNNKIAHEVKIELGLDFHDTPANRLNAVRIAKRRMVELARNSHRTAHMRRDMRRIMLMVFTPDAVELEYRQLENSWPIWWRRLKARHPFLLSLFG